MQPTKINILFVLPNFDKGGSERLVIDIIQNLDKNRYAPVLTVHFSGAYESEFKSSGIPFYVIHENGVLTKAQMYRKLSAIIRQHDIRIVNTHHTSALIQGFIPFKICNKTILIHTEHSKLENDKRIHPMARYVEKLLLKKVDVALGISRALGEYFEARLGVSQRKVQVIPNGIDIAKFDLKNVDRGACRAFLGIEESAPVVGLFGNFRAEKNHAVLVQAITALKKGMPNIQLILCGAGPEEPRLRSLADRLGLRENVKFLGIRSDVPELMQVLDVYCLPSIFEGMPLSLLEA